MTEENHVFLVLDGVRYDVYDNTDFKNLPNNALKSHSGCVWTLPSFFSMLLGWSHANAEKWAFDKGKQADWIPEVLQKKGYHTAFHTGSAWFALPRMKQMYSSGFDKFDADHMNQERMEEWAEKLKFDQEPFFHVIHSLEPHHPAYDGQKQIDFRKNFDHNKMSQKKALGHVDKQFGKMLDNLPEGTVITVTADHGDAWGEDGSWGHNTNSANIEEGYMLRNIPESVTAVPYSRGVVEDGEVEWKNPEELEAEWYDPRKQ